MEKNAKNVQTRIQTKLGIGKSTRATRGKKGCPKSQEVYSLFRISVLSKLQYCKSLDTPEWSNMVKSFQDIPSTLNSSLAKISKISKISFTWFHLFWLPKNPSGIGLDWTRIQKHPETICDIMTPSIPNSAELTPAWLGRTAGLQSHCCRFHLGTKLLGQRCQSP